MLQAHLFNVFGPAEVCVSWRYVAEVRCNVLVIALVECFDLRFQITGKAPGPVRRHGSVIEPAPKGARGPSGHAHLSRLQALSPNIHPGLTFQEVDMKPVEFIGIFPLGPMSALIHNNKFAARDHAGNFIALGNRCRWIVARPKNHRW